MGDRFHVNPGENQKAYHKSVLPVFSSISQTAKNFDIEFFHAAL